MPEFYKTVDGKKLFCDAEGNLIEKDGKHVKVPADNNTAIDIESGADEAAKMLAKALEAAHAAGDKVAVEAAEKALGSMTKLVEKMGELAEKSTQKVAVVETAASFDTEAFESQVKSMVDGQRGTAKAMIRTKEDLNFLAKSTDRSDLTGEVIDVDRDEEITRAPVRSPFLEQIADNVPTESDTIRYIEVAGESGAPAPTAELATIPQKDYTFVARTATVEKIAVINKHSKELLKYGPELVAAVRRMIDIDLRLVVDAQLLSGNGTSPNLQGVLGVAPVLDAAAIGSQRVANANLFDVLRIAATKIATAGKGQFIPNYVILNPVDTETFDLTKNADGDYIMPPFYDASGRLVRGARVIENTGITAGTFLMGDFNYMHVRPNGGYELELSNSDGDDFSQDIIAMKLSRYLAAYVKNNNNGAFMTGTIATAITTLTS